MVSKAIRLREEEKNSKIKTYTYSNCQNLSALSNILIYLRRNDQTFNHAIVSYLFKMGNISNVMHPIL